MAWGAPQLFWLLLVAVICCLGVLFLAARGQWIAWRHSAGFVVGWGLLVLLPLVWFVFGGGASDWTDTVGTYDFAGAIPFHLGVGVAALALALRTRNMPGVDLWGGISGARALAIAALAWPAWTLWLVLMELDFNRMVGPIVAASAILSAGSLTAAMAIERLRTGRNTPLGAVIGLWSGLAASTACCAFVEPLGAAVIGIAAGALAAGAATSRRSLRSLSLAGLIAVTNLSGGGIGLLLLGLFDRGRGFLYTGAPTLPIAQLFGVLAAGLLAVAVTTLLVLIGIRPKTREASAESGN